MRTTNTWRVIPHIILAAILWSFMGIVHMAPAQELQTYTRYYSSGSIMTEHTYYMSNGSMIVHGMVTYWYENGPVNYTGYRNHGKMTGLWTYNNADGSLYETKLWDDNILLQWTRYTTLGNLLFKYDYNHAGATLYSQTIEYHFTSPPTDIRKLVITHVLPNGSWDRAERLEEEYYTNGVLKCVTKRTVYTTPSPILKKTGTLNNGTYRCFYPDGQMSAEWPYTEGEWDGTVLNWCENGTLSSASPYRLGKLHGIAQRWNCNGNPWTLSTAVDGVAHGFHSEWWPNGNLEVTGNYNQGERCGDWTSYWEDGSHPNVTHYSNCADPTPISPAPIPNPGRPDNPNKSISGQVRNQATGAILAGAAVVAGGSATVTSSNGYYQVNVGNRDDVDLSVSMNGFRSWQGIVSLSGVQSALADVNLVPSAGDCGVTDVQSAQGRIFLSGISLSNDYTAAVDWGGSNPGDVIFEINGSERTVAGSSTGAAINCDMGSSFKPSLDPYGNTLRVIARNILGVRSTSSFVLHPVVLPIPGWSLKLGPFIFDKSSGKPVYKLKVDYPKEPVEIELSEKALGGTLWTAWSLVPILGGQELGIPPSQFNFEAELSTEGSGSVGLGGTMAFKVAGAEIQTKVAGKGYLDYDRVGNEGIILKAVDVGGGLKGTVKREYGPVTVIPALAGAVSLPIIGRPIAWFNGRAKIDAAVSVGGDLRFKLISVTNSLTYDSTEGDISCGLELGLGGDIGPVKARIGGGGNTKLTYQFPPKPNYLKSGEVEVAAKLMLEIWSFETEFESKGALTYPPGGVTAKTVPGGTVVSRPRLLTPSFAEVERYNRFCYISPSSRLAGTGNSAPFVSNVFPYAAPSFATRGTNHAVVYVSLDTNKLVAQGNELWASFCNNGQWSPPVAFTQDTRNDFSPSIAYASANQLVAVWERVRPADFTGSSPESLAGHLEIAFAAYNRQTASWSAPAFLTDNSVLDFAPVLAAGPNGEIQVFWLRSPGGQLIGDAGAPLQVWHAAWNGSGFGPPVSHPYAFSNAFDFSFAYDGTRARAAWVQDGDGDLATVDDQQLFYSVFDGTVWGSPVSLLSSNLPSARPTLLCTSSNQWELFWQRGDTLAHLTNWSTPSIEIIRENSGGFSFANFQLSRAGNGQVLLLWHGLGSSMPDIFGRVYDSAQGIWSEDLQITRDAARETFFAGRLCDDGVIRLFYTMDRTNAPVVDMYAVEQKLERNLAADTSRFTLSPELPRLNQPVTITAYVTNSGTLSCAGMTAAFYLGNPLAGGSLISTVPIIPSVLPAGALGAATLSNWVVPTNINLGAVYVVFDSDMHIVEYSESDNTAFVHPTWIDIAVSDITVGEPYLAGDVDIDMSVANYGNDVANNVSVRCTLDGRSIGTVTLPALLPGLLAQIRMTANAKTDFTNTLTIVAVEADSRRELPDINWDNNRLQIEANRVQGRSSMGDGIADDWKRKYFGHINIMADDDPDEDGMSNEMEFLTGTDPADPNSVFHTEQSLFNSFGTRMITWPSQNGRKYCVDKTYDLKTWKTIYSNVTAAIDGNMGVYDAPNTTTNRTFYRVRRIQ